LLNLSTKPGIRNNFLPSPVVPCINQAIVAPGAGSKFPVLIYLVKIVEKHRVTRPESPKPYGSRNGTTIAMSEMIQGQRRGVSATCRELRA
jgi:hypothetical protein